jgi:hypothetical protein
MKLFGQKVQFQTAKQQPYHELNKTQTKLGQVWGSFQLKGVSTWAAKRRVFMINMNRNKNVVFTTV